MKLSECKIGEVVQDTTLKRVGHVVGFEYSCSNDKVDKSSYEELVEFTIPLVKFPKYKEPEAIHHNNLRLYKD